MSDEIAGDVFAGLRVALRETPQGETFLAEAEFGYLHLHRHAELLRPGARVLEIGTGPGFLIRQFAQERSDVSFAGVEPMKGAFAIFRDYPDVARIPKNLSLHDCGYEDFKGSAPFDMIYLINVLEHLPDLRGFFCFLERHLKRDGKCLVLCPAHIFPYEPHVRIPIIFSKRLTGRLFAKRIQTFEREQQALGFWNDLNFVTYPRVKALARQFGLGVTFDTSIVSGMITRLQTDEAFRRRQGLLRWPALLLQKSGLLALFLKTPMLHSMLPYMFLEIRPRADS